MDLKIKALKLKNSHFDTWSSEVEDHWNYRDMKSDPKWSKDWISFDCLAYVGETDTIYAGITSFAADIFYCYDRKRGEFVKTGFEKIANPYDAKFHRSLVYYDGFLYGAVALLHDVDEYMAAPGGAIIKYDPRTGHIEKIGIPIPHVYIQSIVIDVRRGVIYGQTFTPEHLFAFDIETRKTRDLGPIGSGMAMGQGENLVIDNTGNVWGGWSVTRAWQNLPGADSFRLFRYNVSKDNMEYLASGLPKPDGSYGFAKVEGLFNFNSDCLYASGANGSMYRIDVKSGRAEYLFTPIREHKSRLASMALAADGYAYGITGRDGKCQLLKFDPATEKYELLGNIVDQDGINCWQIHDIVSLPDGTLYAGENDVPTRSGYLWEIKF